MGVSMQVGIKTCAQKGARFPEYKTEGASGADVYAFLSKALIIKPGEVKCIPTGLFLEIPTGYEVQVRPRSGLAAKHGITVLNTPGTIDSDYRGEVKVCLINHGKEDFKVSDGDRIAQFVVAPVVIARYTEAESLSTTKRGIGGYGSTGK